MDVGFKELFRRACEHLAATVGLDRPPQSALVPAAYAATFAMDHAPAGVVRLGDPGVGGVRPRVATAMLSGPHWLVVDADDPFLADAGELLRTLGSGTAVLVACRGGTGGADDLALEALGRASSAVGCEGPMDARGVSGG